MSYTDDPIMDFLNYDEEQTRWLESLPICAECGEHIQQEIAVCINGEWYCDECLEDMKRCTGG